MPQPEPPRARQGSDLFFVPFFPTTLFSTRGGFSSPNGNADLPRHVLAIYFEVVKVLLAYLPHYWPGLFWARDPLIRGLQLTE